MAVLFGRFKKNTYLCDNNLKQKPMRKDCFISKAFHLYYDGFRNMTLGKTLWAIILIKLFIIFVILKIFFFPNYIKERANDGDEPDFVANEMIERAE